MHYHFSSFIGESTLNNVFVNLKAVKMTSVKTQLPYEYYTLPFCKPPNLHFKPENLGKF